MAIEPKFERVVSSERIKLGVTQAVIECKLPANDESEIRKVLCAHAKSFITSSEAVDKDINFSGNVNFQVIYENADGVVSGLDYTADFKEKYSNDNMCSQATPIVNSSVVDVNTSINGNDIKIVAIVEITIDIIKNTELNALVNVEGGNVFTNTATLDTYNFVGVLNNKFESNYDIEIKDNVQKVLEVSCSPYIESVTPMEKYAVVVGGANIDICYVTSGEQNVLRTHQVKVDFSQEVALEQLQENSCIQSMLDINNSLIKITTNIDTDFAVVNLNIPYEYTGYAFNQNTLEVIDDAFSTDNYLNVCTESFNTLVCGGHINFEGKVSGNVESEDNAVDEVLGTCCNTVTVASAYVEDGMFVLEGVASTTVMYLNKETNNTYSMLVEMPFSLRENVDVDEKYYPIVNLSLGEVTAKAKRGKDLDVSATLFVYADFYSVNPEAVITEITETEEKPDNLSVLTIYIVKPNETIWDISKLLNINPDSLLEQNPDIELPLQGGEKLVVYRQKEVLF